MIEGLKRNPDKGVAPAKEFKYKQKEMDKPQNQPWLDEFNQVIRMFRAPLVDDKQRIRVVGFSTWDHTIMPEWYHLGWGENGYVGWFHCWKLDDGRRMVKVDLYEGDPEGKLEMLIPGDQIMAVVQAIVDAPLEDDPINHIKQVALDVGGMSAPPLRSK